MRRLPQHRLSAFCLRRALAVSATLLVSLSPPVSRALEQGEIRYNGYGTLGITHLGGEDGLDYGIRGQTTSGWRGDQLSKVGGQLQYGLSDTLSVTGQLALQAEQDHWQLTPAPLYLAWQADHQWTLRAGRLGTPFYMYSETLNIGFSYPWLRLPEEVYSLVELSTHDGAEVLYNTSTPLGVISLQISAGQAHDRQEFALGDLHDIDYKNVLANSLTLSTEHLGSFRLGYTETDVSLDIRETVDTRLMGRQSLALVTIDGLKGKFSSIGHQYDNGTWLSAAESVKLLIENNPSDVDAFYLMLGRRAGNLLAHVTYGQLECQDARQRSMTYGLNYSLSPSVTLKGEYKRVDVSQSDYFSCAFSENAQQGYDNGLYQASQGQLGQPLGRPDADIISVGFDFIF